MQDSGFSIQDIQPTHAHKSISMQVIAAKLKEINAGRSCRGDGEGGSLPMEVVTWGFTDGIFQERRVHS